MGNASCAARDLTHLDMPRNVFAFLSQNDTCPENISSWEEAYMLRNANKRIAVIYKQLHKCMSYVYMIIKDTKIKLVGKRSEIIGYTQETKPSICREYLPCALAS